MVIVERNVISVATTCGRPFSTTAPPTGPWTADCHEGIGRDRGGFMHGVPLAVLPFAYGTEVV